MTIEKPDDPSDPSENLQGGRPVVGFIVVFDVPLGLAFSAGMLATVNPCGFAMLPAYLGFFVGSDEDREGRFLQALKVSAAMTSGFLVVFGAVGMLVQTVASSIDQHLAKATVVVGVGLIALGVWLLSGRELRLRGPKIERGGRDRGFVSMFWFGVSYATASLSCTLGPFLVALTPTFRNSGVAAGSLAFVAYSLGMGAVITVATVAIAGAQRGVVGWLRRSGPMINRISGGLLIVAGFYVVWYGWWDLRGDFDEDPIIDGASRIQTWLTEKLASIDPLVGFVGGVVVVALVVVLRRVRRVWTGGFGARLADAAAEDSGKTIEPGRVSQR